MHSKKTINRLQHYAKGGSSNMNPLGFPTGNKWSIGFTGKTYHPKANSMALDILIQFTMPGFRFIDFRKCFEV